MNILIGYPIAYGCSKKTTTNVQAIAKVSFATAHSTDEAVGIAVRMAREEFLVSDGYTEHWGIATSVSMTPGYMKELLNGV